MHYCPYCQKEVDTEVRQISEIFPVLGEQIEVESNVRFCKECGADIWDEELDSKNLQNSFDAYRHKHGLMTSDTIRKMRESYGLSQKDFSAVLGFNPNTILRLERGSIQSVSENNLLLLCQNPENFKVILHKNRDNISAISYEIAMKFIH